MVDETKEVDLASRLKFCAIFFSLSSTAELCSGSSENGWQFWKGLSSIRKNEV